MISKLVNADYNSSTNWEDETIIKTALKPGHYGVHFSEMGSSDESDVLSGSSIDICGSLYVFDSDTTPTGTLYTGAVNYLIVYDSGGVGVLEYTMMSPSYNDELKGWYDDSNLKRYIMKIHGSDKYLITNISDEDFSYQNEMNEYKNSIRTYLYSGILATEQIHRDTDTVRRKNLYIGTDCAINDDYLVAGCPGWGYASNYGAVYVYKRTGSNTFSEYVTLEEPTAASQDKMGTRVSIDGDYIAAGAQGYNRGAENNAGAVMVYHRTGDNVWDSGVTLCPTDTLANDSFGASDFNILGDYVAAGAELHDLGAESNAGAAYVFHRTGTNTWDSGTKIVGSDTNANDYFGACSELFDGAERLAVGADRASSSAGAIYLYERTGLNSWGNEEIISKPSVFGNNQGFGKTCKISGNIMVAGIASARLDAINGEGAICIYERHNGDWGDPIIISNPDPTEYSHFGYKIDICGDTILVGVYREPVEGVDDVGAAYIIYKDGDWKIGQKLIASDGAVDDRFSEGLALGPGLAAIGAPYAIDGGTEPEKYTKMYTYSVPMVY